MPIDVNHEGYEEGLHHKGTQMKDLMELPDPRDGIGILKGPHEHTHGTHHHDPSQPQPVTN